MYLAGKGWQVRAFDISEKGLEVAQQQDRHPRVPGDLERGELPSFFPDFEVLQYTESEDTTDFFHLKMPVGHLLARKR